MQISLSRLTRSANPKDIIVNVNVSAQDHAQADLLYSHSFHLQPIQTGRSVAVDIFTINPNSADLRKYGKKLFRALFSEDESSPASRLLGDLLRPHAKRRILLELNGDHDLDIIPWEYAWGKNTRLTNNSELTINGYLTNKFIFTRVHKRKVPQLSKFQLLPMRIVTIVPDPIVPPNDPSAKQFPDLNPSEQFQTFCHEFEKIDRKILLQRVFPPTVERMYTLLTGKSEMATVLHFVGHCGSRSYGARALIFEHKDTGGLDFVYASLLDKTPENVRLAFLSACDTRHVARVLVERGIPYTIGSHCLLPDDLARKFESKFYQLIAGGSTVETAMLKARASMHDSKDSRQRHYFPGAMVLYSSTFREEDGAFKCEKGKPTVEAHMPPHNLEVISITPYFYGRKKELLDLTGVLRRMVDRGKRPCGMYTITGIGGQGKTTLAERAVRRLAHLFPGGVFAWRFDPSQAISAIKYLQGLGQVIFQEDLGNNLQTLELTIIRKFVSYPTCLLILDQADVLERAEALGDEGAVALVNWLHKIISAPDVAVKILATSHQRLRWKAEEGAMHLGGLTDLDIDSGVELFIRNLDSKVRQRMEKEKTITQLLHDLVKHVDGHPLCLELLGHATGKPRHQNASLKKLVHEHFSTMLVDGAHGSRNLRTRFRQTIDELPIQQRLLLYMCSLFNGPITELVLAFIRYFVQNVGASSEGFDLSIKAIAENLQQLCDRKLLSKRDEEYNIHVALREGVRQCNSIMKLGLYLPISGFYDDTFVIGVAKQSKSGISVVLEWQLRNIQHHDRSEVKDRTYGVQYYDIVDIPGHGGHKLEKNTMQKQAPFGGLVVFRRKASEVLDTSFPKFCIEQITPIVTERKTPFILCLHHTDAGLTERSTTNAERNISLMKKAMETLRSGLKKTHFIIRTELPLGIIIHGRELLVNSLPASKAEADQPTKGIDFGIVNTYGRFVGRQQELQRLEELLRDKTIRYITIRGLGGMGKTELAIQAVKNFNFGRVLVISLIGNPSSDSVISTIAGLLNIDVKGSRDPKIRQNAVMAKLARGGAMLLYLDNLENIKHETEHGDPATKKDAISLMRFFSRISGNVKILTTSRIALGWPNEEFVELTGLAPHDGMQIFRQWACQNSDSIDDDNAKKISNLAGGHPLSIRLLGGIFNKFMEPVDQFINHISDRLRNTTDTLDEPYDSADTCIQYSFDHLDVTLRSLLGQLRQFDVPFSTTLVKKALNRSTTSSALSVENNLHILWQQSWLNELRDDPTHGDWRPRFMENDTRFYTLHPRLRDFLNHQLADGKDTVADMLNDPEIQFFTALCYKVGFGVANDLEKQIEWCTKAAINGHLEAQLTIAVCYEEGAAGVDVDKKAGFEWYLKAAEAGDKGAQHRISRCYCFGDGVERDSERGDYWRNRYRENKTAPLSIKFDFSLPLLHRAAEAGHVSLIRSLLSQPDGNVNLKDRHGRTPLHLAAQKGHINVLELLISESSPDINARDREGNTPVHRAAESGRIEFIAVLIAEFGADPNAKNNDGGTPLHVAAKCGNVEVVKLLVAEMGADSNAKNNDGSTPLLFAARNGHVEIVKLLVAEFGEDVNIKNNDGWTPLLSAAKCGHVEVVKLLVAEFGADANAKNNNGSTPLHWVTASGNIEVVKLLVTEVGADANAKNKDGWTPLLIAAKSGYVEIVKLLVAEFGADANTKNNDGLTPLHQAAANGNVEVMKLLVVDFGADADAKNNDGSTPLHQAAANGNVEVIKLLVVEFGADLNAKKNGGWTPLHLAAQNGHVEVVRLLVAEWGADANTKKNDGWTPLHLASQNGHVEVVRLLVVEFGVDANDKNNDGWTPLHVAAQNGHTEVVKWLVVEFGANANDKNNDGWTPLHIATRHGHVEVVKFLVAEFGEDANAKDDVKWTPLQLAAGNGHVIIVRLLVTEFGADANDKNNDGWTPLHLSARHGHVEVARLLVAEFGANTNNKNNDGWTPLHLAAQNGHTEVVRLLVADFGADPNDKSNDRWTPLHLAAQRGHVKVVRLLVTEFGADVNAKKNDGWMPLHTAAQKGHVEVVRLLVSEFGADANDKNNNGWIPLHMAAQKGHAEVVRLFVAELGVDANTKENDGWTPLHLAAQNGHVEVVRLLVVEFGTEVNDKNIEGWTPLLLAVQKGYAEVVRFLVGEFGADANKSNDGWTPLCLAARHGHVEVVRLLLSEFGEDVKSKDDVRRAPLHLAAGNGHVKVRADANAKMNDGLTPLHHAAQSGHIEVVRLLVSEFGADANAKNENEWTPLHFAAGNGHGEVVRLLLTELGADANSKKNDGWMPLHSAALQGQAEVVRLLVAEFGANINDKNNDGWTPLHLAARQGHVEVVRLLVVEFGADANDKNNDGWTPLHVAAQKGHTEVVRLLVAEFVADANTKNNDGWAPLHFAARNGHVEIVRLLMAEFAEDAKDDVKWTLLYLAAENGQVKVVRLLVAEFGAGPNAKKNNVLTPLHYAAQNGHFEVVTLLVAEFGADANAKDENEWTPLHLAAGNGHVKVVRLLVSEFGADANPQKQDEWMPLHSAAQKGHAEIVRFLVAELGTDANSKKTDGCTPLHLASQNGHVEVVTLLVAEFGADANDKNNDGRTSLHLAAQNGHTEVVRLLVAEFGANANAKDDVDWTPLHLAAGNGCVKVVRLLVAELESDANAKKNDGWTPLHSAAQKGYAEVVRLLVAEFGADANDKNNDGWTPLHLAAQKGHTEVVRLLVTEFRADANDKNNDEWTPLHLAAGNGHVEVVRLFVSEFGADVNVKGDVKWTPLHLAAGNGHVEAVRLLVGELGADANTEKNDGWTPLHLAAQNGHTKVVRLLVADFGADANDKTNDGWTPLHLAAQKGHADVVRLLVVEFGADVNARKNDRWTPLHYASQNGHTEVTRLLKDKNAWTPLHRTASTIPRQSNHQTDGQPENWNSYWKSVKKGLNLSDHLGKHVIASPTIFNDSQEVELILHEKRLLLVESKKKWISQVRVRRIYRDISTRDIEVTESECDACKLRLRFCNMMRTEVLFPSENLRNEWLERLQLYIGLGSLRSPTSSIYCASFNSFEPDGMSHRSPSPDSPISLVQPPLNRNSILSNDERFSEFFNNSVTTESPSRRASMMSRSAWYEATDNDSLSVLLRGQNPNHWDNTDASLPPRQPILPVILPGRKFNSTQAPQQHMHPKRWFLSQRRPRRDALRNIP